MTRLQLGALTALDADTAAALAEFPGESLHLDGLTALDVATAAALAACRAQDIGLGGLATLDAPAARALAAFKGRRLSIPMVMAALGGGIPLGPEMARLVCVCASAPESAVELPQVVAFDSRDAVEIASILATTKGSLSLPSLAKISPRTLTALIRKENVRIPPFATLELIQEPDGSPTDDFVIPEGFADQQLKQQVRPMRVPPRPRPR